MAEPAAPALQSAARRSAGSAYRRALNPAGRRALSRMLGEGLPPELELPLGVLLGAPPPASAERVSAVLEHRRAELRGRDDVLRFAYSTDSPLARWPDKPEHAQGEEVSIRWLASAASVPERWGTFLHLCTAAIGARRILELGACSGISGGYLAAAPCVEEFVTIEGSPPLARVAAETLGRVNTRARVVEGSFDRRLPGVLAELTSGGHAVDLAFVDGHHDGPATLGYLELLGPHLRPGSIVVLDDIRLYRSMWLAWQRARELPTVATTVDTGRFGLLVWGKGDSGQRRHHDLHRYTGRWRLGPPRPWPSQAATDATPRSPPPVTVVVPVWGKNADHRLDRALESIRGQSVPSTIVLVDNAENPPLAQDGVTIVRSDKRVTIGAARNLGLDAVRSPVVVFWDADDVMLDGTLEVMVGALERAPDMVACCTLLTDARTGARHHWPRRWPLKLSRFPAAFALLNAISSAYPVVGAAIRTPAAHEARFPDHARGEDWVLGVSLALRGRVGLEARPGRLYTRDSDAVSRSWRTRDLLAHAAAVRARLREDPMAPRSLILLLAPIWLAQHMVLLGLRPLARQTPRRRRAGV